MRKYVDETTLKEICSAIVYPIGSIYISSINTNPSTLFGGTWTLVNKSFTSTIENGTTDYFTPSSNLSSANVYLSLSGNSLFIRLGMTTAVDIKDSSVSLGTFNLATLGITSLPVNISVYGGNSDGGGAVVMSTLSTAGALSAVEVVAKTDGILDAGSTVYNYYSFVIPYTLMIDSSCNEFHWKRTA